MKKQELWTYIYPFLLLVTYPLVGYMIKYLVYGGASIERYSLLNSYHALGLSFLVIFLACLFLKKWGRPGVLQPPRLELMPFLVTIGAYFLLDWLNQQYWIFFPHHHTMNESLLRQESTNPPVLLARVIYLFSICCLGPLQEELIYRGAFMGSFFKDSHYGLDIFFSSFWFALPHVWHSSWSWIDFGFYMLGGCVMGGLFRLTKSLYYTVAFHMAWNTIASWPEIYNLIYWNFLV